MSNSDRTANPPEEEIVLPSDNITAAPYIIHPEHAIKTIQAPPFPAELWMSRHRHAYLGPNSEELARRDGATHVPCLTCKQPAKKPALRCESCKTAHERACYLNLPCRDWDGTELIWSEVLNDVFRGPEYLVDAAMDLWPAEETTELNLLVYPVKPVPCPVIDECGFFERHLAPDSELPDEVQQAMEAYNNAVEGIVLSYDPDYTQRLYCGILSMALQQWEEELDEHEEEEG